METMLSLEQLEMFCAVVRSGSMSRAAALLHVSQPAISQQIRALEAEFGTQLLVRTHRGVEPTPAGDALVRYARRILVLGRSLRAEIEALREAAAHRLVVGATPVIGGYALPCTIYLFRRRYPDARIDLVIANTTEVLQRLQDGLLHMAVIEGPLPSDVSLQDHWATQVLTEDTLVLVTPAKGPLAEKERFHVQDLREVPLILREKGSGTRRAIEERFPTGGVAFEDLNVVMELSSLEAIKTSVEAGHGVALLSRWTVRKEVHAGALRIAPLDGVTIRLPWTLIYSRTQSRTPLERQFLRTLRSPTERGFC